MASAGRWISVTVGGAERETVHTGPLARAVPRQRRVPARTLMDGLEQVDPKSSEAEEFMSILSELDKSCTK
jgi:hypothetical protein